MLYAILKPLVVLLMRLLFRVEARGTEHVPAEGAVLIVGNHSSFLDPPLVGGMAPRPLTFLAKAELFGVPILGPLIRRLGAHPVRREGADAAALRTAQRVLEEGKALLVFPEGTRGDEGVLRPAKPGAALLAMHTGVPVVPVYVHGSGRAWPRGRRLPRPAKVMVTFGPPLRFPRASGTERKAQYEAAGRRMMAAIAGLRDELVRGADVARARRPLQIH
jgi:1-acyl-sn-glycerol-3-phosphate acyltransferase